MPSPDVAAAIAAWNHIGGEMVLDDRLAVAAELVGQPDIEILIAQLDAVRNHMREDA